MHNFSNLLRFLNYLNLEFSKNNKIEYDLFLDTECKHIDIALLQNVESNASNEGVQFGRCTYERGVKIEMC